MPRRVRPAGEMSRLAQGSTWLLSLAVHGAIAAVCGWLAFRTIHRPSMPPDLPAPAPDAVVAVELPVVAEGTLLAEHPPDVEGSPPERSGGAVVPRIDTATTGRGGDPTVDKAAVHLSDVDERLRLSSDLLSRLDRDQTQRVRSSASRASWEDRRSTTHPAELTFVASGEGEREERRALSPADPSRGALRTRPPSVRGGAIGTPVPVGEEGARSAIGGAQLGTLDAAPGRGVRDGVTGADHRSSAAVAFLRPAVERAPIAVQASERSRVRDDVDAEQEVATVLRSLVHGSTAGGPLGDGRGGTGGGGDPGAGGDRGAGSHPHPLGDGVSDWFDIDTTDPRLLPYFRHIHARIEPLWADAFPKSAMLELKQGTVILEFVVAQDGSARVVWPPLRPSGIDEFDRNCAEAIRKAGPFDPIPREVGRSSLRIRAPFVASSAIVPTRL